jgi:hypothetical protein
MLRLAHHTKAENNNNATNHWLKTRFFILFRLGVITTPAVFDKGKTLSMTSEVMGEHVLYEDMCEPDGFVVKGNHRFSIIGWLLVQRAWLIGGKKFSMRISCGGNVLCCSEGPIEPLEVNNHQYCDE